MGLIMLGNKEVKQKLQQLPTDELGKCARSYDNDPFMDLTWMAYGAKPSDLAEIKKQYEKLKEDEKIKDDHQDEKAKRLKVIIEVVEALQKKDKAAALKAFQNYFPDSRLERIGALSQDVYYSVRDFFKWQRVKTSLTIIGSIAVGAAAGAVLGTVVFPVIGSAIGGAAGAAIGGASAFFGGTIGLSLIGGVAGSWLGTTLSKKLFKYETKYQPSTRVTDRLNNQIGIDSKTAWRINAYLYNRSKATSNTQNKKIYKKLRKEGIAKANKDAIEQMAYFFCNELALLHQEIDKKDPAQADEIRILKQEVGAVRHILQNLNHARGHQSHWELPARAKKVIEDTLDIYRTKSKKTKAVKALPKSVKVGKKRSEKRFEKNLDVHGLRVQDKKVQKVGNQLLRQYTIASKDDEAIPEVVFKKINRSENPRAQVVVRGDALNEQNQEKVFQALVAQAKAYAQSHEGVKIRVIAGKDPNYAVLLMAAAFKAGLDPKLQKKEFPDLTEEDRLKRRRIIQEAQALARMDRPSGKVGLGFDLKRK
jgi:hypothetical protein